ncbi:phosphonate ABC transporter, permease protein PhnE [Halalkalibacter akibai]|uniref:Phosphonate ABC transporter permease protein PhnE1 n=1 Tax=Halalkalibacter akibai (strain ATCC 43226 / DSM 21942 / CIP 109018 / JCM 9157 / 1139) TaxID=1236973 RepID=W4R087_HALA3|nr:phosphonate ABC transporter, permease protein PhnE [Halalkalibacter akibai]GAE37328.1 phosphonate ABC transporter permease protein PhnE1 [Halalkalibacter akibai JCM 9157]
MNTKIQIEKPKKGSRYWLRVGISAAVIIFLYYIALTQTDLSYRGSALSPGALLERLFWNPFFDEAVLAKVPSYFGYMLETLAIAYAGTLIGSILAIPIGFLAATNVSKYAFVGKWILNAIRAFPEIMFAIIFVAAVGMGPYAGVLAIGINSIGMLGKLYSEVIESIDMSVLETFKANGASRLQTIWFGIIPQVVPEFASYAIYRYEIDVRSSTVLGVVGAGGIGAPIIIAAMQRSWEQVGMMLLIIILVVSIIDFISTRIRKRLV